MSRDLNLLNPEFKEQVDLMLRNLIEEGFELRPFFTRRTPKEQARFWRQSRSTIEIRKAADRLTQEGALWIAKTLLGVGPQHGRWATNALPGQSWHQWGEAIDCFVVSDLGKAVWSTKHEGYEAYAKEAKRLGLTAGYFWMRKDAVHVQFRSEPVRATHTWIEIDREMREKFKDA